MKRPSLVLVTWLAMCAPAAAQSPLVGTWRVDATPDWTVEFRLAGAQLTGTVNRCTSARPVEIFDVHVDGDNVTFKCTSLTGGRTITLTGTLSGDEIAFAWRLDVAAGGVPLAPTNLFGSSSPTRFTAKRVASNGG